MAGSFQAEGEVVHGIALVTGIEDERALACVANCDFKRGAVCGVGEVSRCELNFG